MCALSVSGVGLSGWAALRARLAGMGPARKKFDASVWPRPEKEQLERYAEAFYGLSGLFQAMPCQKERLGDVDLERLFREVKEQVCAECSRSGLCWENQYFDSCQVFYDVLEGVRRSRAEKSDRGWRRGACIRSSSRT